MLPGSLNHEPDLNAIFFTHFRSLTIMKGARTWGVLPYISRIGMYCSKGRVLGPFWSENTLPILVWNRVWFFTELQELT